MHSLSRRLVPFAIPLPDISTAVLLPVNGERVDPKSLEVVLNQDVYRPLLYEDA